MQYTRGPQAVTLLSGGFAKSCETPTKGEARVRMQRLSTLGLLGPRSWWQLILKYIDQTNYTKRVKVIDSIKTILKNLLNIFSLEILKDIYLFICWPVASSTAYGWEVDFLCTAMGRRNHQGLGALGTSLSYLPCQARTTRHYSSCYSFKSSNGYFVVDLYSSVQVSWWRSRRSLNVYTCSLAWTHCCLLYYSFIHTQ